MTKAIRWLCVSAAAMGAMLAILASSNRAQETPPRKHDAKMLSDSLKVVIDIGARMFNEQGDHAGCYRLWQGSLLSVKPFVTPELQNRITEGLRNAEQMGSYADRAFELRKVLDEIRGTGKAGAKKDDVKDKKPEEKGEKKDDAKDTKKDDAKDKKEEKKTEPAGKTGPVRGSVSFEGKPIAGGYSVILIGSEKKKFTTTLEKDGSFQFAMPLPVGEYTVILELPENAKAPMVLPPRYFFADKSSLLVIVSTDKNNFELKLVK